MLYFILFYSVLLCISIIFVNMQPPPSAPDYDMISAPQNSNSNLSEIQKLLAANPNILNDLAKLIDNTNKIHQPLALARFNWKAPHYF